MLAYVWRSRNLCKILPGFGIDPWNNGAQVPYVTGAFDRKRAQSRIPTKIIVPKLRQNGIYLIYCKDRYCVELSDC